ncbi:MAG: mevalonate kinase [Anaerolineae bacterium]|nr:mevalonate kinase [Anaerolineae bacterium]
MAGITERSACAKVILVGEHAVVYGRPAIALPLPHLRAYARVSSRKGNTEIAALDIHQRFRLQDRPHNPLSQIVLKTFAHLNLRPEDHPLRLTIKSEIPVASHLGSGAAVSVACARAICAHITDGADLASPDASALAYEVEKLHHGTPSGIDNTVIAYEQPVWFVRGETPVTLEMPSALRLVIADTGISTPTKIPVGQVRQCWERDKEGYERRFDAIAALVMAAREALEANDWPALGTAMSASHIELQQLGVSSPKLDKLCDAAIQAGALGAKMSGGGQGGNMIALARDDDHASDLKYALSKAGATRVL